MHIFNTYILSTACAVPVTCLHRFIGDASAHLVFFYTPTYAGAAPYVELPARFHSTAHKMLNHMRVELSTFQLTTFRKRTLFPY